MIDIDGLRAHIMFESHNSRYLIHPNSTMMDLELRKFYWWIWIKKDIVGFVRKWPNCQQTKIEYHRPSCKAQDISIP